MSARGVIWAEENFKPAWQIPEARQKINSYYWNLSDNIIIPKNMAFVPNGEGPFLLVVAVAMHIDRLISNLEWIGNRMSIM